MLQIDQNSLVNWERNQRHPLVRHYPRVIDFLGYCPVQYPRTRGERFRLFRTHRGYSRALTAKFLAVDPSTITAWEADRETGWPDHERKIAQFLDGSPAPEEVARNYRKNPDYYRLVRDPQTLGERLRHTRIKQRLRLEDVARIIGVRSPRTISVWERGEASPLADNLERVTRFLNEATDEATPIPNKSATCGA